MADFLSISNAPSHISFHKNEATNLKVFFVYNFEI